MFFNTCLRRFGLVLSVVLLTACASNGTKQANSQDNGTATAATSSASATNDAQGAQSNSAHKAPAVVKPVVIVANPTVITFEKMSIVLDDKGRTTVVQAADRAKSASKIMITGFCDRRQIGNAENSAVARAIAVRDELVAQGVLSSKMQVKVDTRTAKKHAAEIKFD